MLITPTISVVVAYYTLAIASTNLLVRLVATSLILLIKIVISTTARCLA
jgi:hypothetical protein